MYLTKFPFTKTNSVRGTITSTLVLTENSGILLSFILGHFCSFHTTPVAVIALIALFAVLIYFFFPETPMFLVKQNKILVSECNAMLYHITYIYGK